MVVTEVAKTKSRPFCVKCHIDGELLYGRKDILAVKRSHPACLYHRGITPKIEPPCYNGN